MINAKHVDSDNIRLRNNHTIDLKIEEYPERAIYTNLQNYKRRKTVILKIEKIVRNSIEYRDYIKMIRSNRDWSRCATMQGIRTGNGKKYTIEIHHEPFSLFDIAHTFLNMYEDLNKDINLFHIARDITALHYDGKVGLVPLSKTIHQLVGNGKVFIPMQLIFDDWYGFYEEYEQWIPEMTKQHVDVKLNMSQKANGIQSNVLNTDFTYVNIEGVSLPEIPEEWAVKLYKTDYEKYNEEEEQKKLEKEAKKKKMKELTDQAS